MAIYGYRCPSDGDFELDSPMSDTKLQTPCPECGHLSPKVMSGHLQFTYGKANFHGPTINENLEELRKGWELDGFTGDRTPEPV